MIWFELAAYFFVWAIVLVGMLEVYAWLLRLGASLPPLLRLIAGLSVYLFVALIMVAPLLGVGGQHRWRSVGKTFVAFDLIYLLGYLCAVLPSIVYFKITHLKQLKRLGYFKDR